MGALKTNNTAVAIITQPVADTFTDPVANKMPVSQCRLAIEGITVSNDEYTGSPIRNADDIAGKRCTLTFNIKLRPPGGASPPAANAFLPGLILQAAKFTEVVTAAAIPVGAPEALSAGTTTGATLGATAVGTTDLYKGMAISVTDEGTNYKGRMTALRAYTSAKLATFMETYSVAPASTYQIPKQLGYIRDVSSADPILLSTKIWIDGHRYDLMNCRVSGLQVVVPTSTKDQAAYPELQVSLTADISANSAEATPAVTPLGAVPLFKDGDCWLAGKRIGTSTFTIDLGLGIEYPPNPNKPDGVDAAELVSGSAKVSLTRQKYLPSYLDSLALADAQSAQPFFAQWGSAAGSMVQIVVPDSRLNYGNPDMGGNIVMESQDLMIDALSRSMAINFPY